MGEDELPVPRQSSGSLAGSSTSGRHSRTSWRSLPLTISTRFSTRAPKPARPLSPAANHFRAKVKQAQLLLISSSKVAEENKIGEPPRGWFRDVALALQTGIASEPASSSSSSSSARGGFWAAEPELFARVRAACGVPPARYAATMGLQQGRQEPTLRVVGTSAASGKSGAFFLFSPDQQCIAKSCTTADWKTLLRVLPAYVERFEAARTCADARACTRNRESHCSGFLETLLPRYLGLYTLRGVAGDDKVIRVLVMANVFGGSRMIHRRYDLKGSTTGRLASAKELKKHTPVLKDLDWVRQESPLAVPEETRARVIKALEEDVRCLQDWGLMDYSLLLGVHDLERQESSRYEAMNVVCIKDEKRLSYIGMVDILTCYGWRKWAETWATGKLRFGRDVSCQAPKYYGQRFLSFIQTSVVTEEEAETWTL